jgi:thiol-disulfide isomerase/thioredoxin
MSNKKEEKNIPAKNYFALAVIIIATLIATLYIFSWFKQYNNSKVTTPIITSTLREVEYDNLNTVLQERDVLIMYMCTTNEKTCRNFEKKFSSYIKKNNLTEDIIYLNLGYDSDEDELLEKVYDKYKSKDLVKKIHKYPTLLIFNEGKIVDVLSSNGKKELTIKHIKEFFEGYEL